MPMRLFCEFIEFCQVLGTRQVLDAAGKASNVQ